MNHLLVEAILLGLESYQLDFLSMVNFDMNKHIKRNRLVLPRTKFEWLDIQMGFDEGSFLMKIDDNGCEIEVTSLEVMSYLKAIQVETLKMDGDEACEHLDRLWLRDIDFIGVSNIKNKENIENFFKKTNCTKLSLTHNEFELDGEEILDNMPAVEYLVLEKANFTEKFFTKLAEKSKVGNGLDWLVLKDWNEKPFNAEVFIDFLKNAKFRSGPKANYISLNTGLEDVMMITFQRMLLELNEVPNWEVKKVAEDVYFDKYEIVTPSASIELMLEYKMQ